LFRRSAALSFVSIGRIVAWIRSISPAVLQSRRRRPLSRRGGRGGPSARAGRESRLSGGDKGEAHFYRGQRAGRR